MKNKIFAVFRVKEKKSEKAPDYNISMKTGEVYTTIGACWIKESNGNKFLSCKLSNGSEKYAGFSVVQDSNLTEEDKAQIQALRAGEAAKKEVKDELDIEGIPF